MGKCFHSGLVAKSFYSKKIDCHTTCLRVSFSQYHNFITSVFLESLPNHIVIPLLMFKKSYTYRTTLNLLRSIVPLVVLFCNVCLLGCITEDMPPNTKQGNFEALWKIMDEHYCFFDYKKEEFGIDWDEVRNRYAPAISEGMSDEALFEVCAKMIGELRDGHVNLISAHDVARYADWYEKYATNFSDSLLRIYLGSSASYRIAASLRYKVLDGNIGYIRVPTFENTIGSGNISQVMRYLASCDGLIVDVRSNGGGLMTAAADLAGIFINEPEVGGYICHKTGKGRNDFSAPWPIDITPASGLRWQKNAVILTNRRTYSAANSFVMFCKGLSHVVVMGDITGGGAGLPFTSSLPNGWSLRLSACPMYDREMRLTEQGIEPDIYVSILAEDYANGKDTMIEHAKNYLRSHSND